MQIASGPFKGMRYTEGSHASVLIPKLLGIYEKELWEIIEGHLSTPFKLIVDIGAAEGYYAVGFAKFNSCQSRVVAFETSLDGRCMLGQNASLNGVSDKIEVFGECTAELLCQCLPGSDALVICDIEGGEREVLDPEMVPKLKNAFILVELHKKKSPGIEKVILDRFADSHCIQAVHQLDRTEIDFPYWTPLLSVCPKVYLRNSVSEFRQPWEESMTWLWMRPKAGEST